MNIYDARKIAHEEFDKLWKYGPLNRNQAYLWLRTRFQLKEDEAHISKFDERQCAKLCRLVKEVLKRVTLNERKGRY